MPGHLGSIMASKPSRWLLAPLHVLALGTGAKSFRDNPVIGNCTLNRLGLHVAEARGELRRLLPPT
jgi:hypothetical protein